MRMDKSICSRFQFFHPFCLSFCFPFYVAFVFFAFCWFAFCIFHFFAFFALFSSFKKIRISYGLVNITIVESIGRNTTAVQSMTLIWVLGPGAHGGTWSWHIIRGSSTASGLPLDIDLATLHARGCTRGVNAGKDRVPLCRVRNWSQELRKEIWGSDTNSNW